MKKYYCPICAEEIGDEPFCSDCGEVSGGKPEEYELHDREYYIALQKRMFGKVKTEPKNYKESIAADNQEVKLD